MQIRPEGPQDVAAIHELTRVAFAPMAFSDGTEPDIIDRLRADGDLTLSLVVEEAGEIVGHAAFSRVGLEAPGEWFCLGPASVAPHRQRCGIGTGTIATGLAILRDRGAAGCVVEGNPLFYSRFGFRSDFGLSHGDLEPQYVQGLPFGDTLPTGEIAFARAFGG